MRKLLPIILVLSILLTSCNLPLTSQPTLDANLIATRVAETLAVLQPEASPSVQPQVTSEPPVAPPPTETLQPTSTPTITPTATYTAQPDDPALTLGQPEFFDTFQSGTAFGLTSQPLDDDEVITKVENGAMVFQAKDKYWGRRWRLTSRNPLNMYLEGTFKTVSCSGFDQYGLVLRAPSYGDGAGYYFGVSCNGHYNFFWYDKSGNIHKVVDWTADTRILTAANQVNRLGIMANGDSFKLYINGAFVKEVTDTNIKDKGFIGVFVSASESSTYTVHVEEISLWPQP
jgi:hypothetical protein